MDDEDRMAALVESVMAMLESGPLPMTEVVRCLDDAALLEVLREDGVEEDDLGEAILEEVVESDAVWATAEQIIARTDLLLDGLVLTHRLTTDELADGEVRICPDLVIIDWSRRDELALVGGGRLHRIPSREPRPGFDHSTLAGPQGWLDAFAPGDVLAFRLSVAGLSLEPAGVLADDHAEVDALCWSVESRLGDDEGDEAIPFILDAITIASGAFRRPVRPLGELLEAAGLEQRGFSFGRRGFPWRTFAEGFDDRRRARVVEAHALDDCCIESFDQVLHAYEEFGTIESDVRAVGAALAHGFVPQAFADYVMHRLAASDEHLVRFANHLLAGLQGRHRAAPQHLLGIEAERRGAAREAENWFIGALRDDPDDAGSALAQIDYAVDRGDLARALRLIRHPGLVPGDEMVRFLDDVRREVDSLVGVAGRNDPCPCGSGRKFKVCCAREPKIPLSARVRLLSYKLSQFARSEPRRLRLVAVASRACDPDDPNPVEQIRSFAANNVIVDFALYEGGVARDYLDQRGSLLPADERELVDAVLASPRGLWEVVDVDSGRGLVLRDAATAETIHVVERTASRQAATGELVLSRVARLSDQTFLWGTPVRVPLRSRESTLALMETEPDAYELASWFRDAIALPSVMTRDDEPLVIH